MRCPACEGRKGILDMLGPRPARLDQSGASYLPAESYVCGHCDLIITRPVSTAWRPYEWVNDGEVR